MNPDFGKVLYAIKDAQDALENAEIELLRAERKEECKENVERAKQ